MTENINNGPGGTEAVFSSGNLSKEPTRCDAAASKKRKVLNIIPAAGVCSMYRSDEDSSVADIYPLACWALVEDAETKETYVAGMDLSTEEYQLTFCSDSPDFIGYTTEQEAEQAAKQAAVKKE